MDGATHEVRMERAVRWLLAAGAVLALLALYGWNGDGETPTSTGHSAIRWMVRRWNMPGGEMSHGWLVPLVSLAALWRDRKALLQAPRRPCVWGLAGAAGALLLLVLGVRVQQTRLSLFSLVGLLWSVPLYLFGPAVAARLVFPCGYLLLFVPMSFLDVLAFPLRRVASAASAVLLNGLGISTTRVGTMLYVGPDRLIGLEVADACSGLRYLLAMVAVAGAYAHFTQEGLIRKWVVFAAAVPVAMVGNIVRVMLIGVVAVGFGPGAALRVYHYASGFIIFSVAVLLMIGWGTLVTRWGSHGQRVSS